LFGLAGAGDMFLTCTDSHSRNYAYGLALGSGKPPPTHLAEGAKTVASLMARASSLGVDTPIIAAIDNVINHDVELTIEIKTLLARPVDQE
jgi:glycerol-3-phosphate dehydrogenase (NAD(P)+)